MISIQNIDHSIVALIALKDDAISAIFNKHIDFDLDDFNIALKTLRDIRQQLYPETSNKLSLDFSYDYGVVITKAAERFLETGELK